jgi:hypothetical protein
MSKNVIIGIVSFASFIYSFSEIDSVGMLSKIQNVWKYEYSYGGFAGTKKYPSDNYKLMVESASSFKEYRNDTLINTDSFALQRNILSGRTYYKIIIKLKMIEGSTVQGSEGYYIDFLDDSTLVLDEGCCDRYAFYFKILKTATNTPLDTLQILESFDSPVPNPRAILYDSPDFWISNMRPLLYKVDSRMRLIDSLPLRFGRVTGMTFKDEELWVLRDSAGGNFLFRIDRETGTVLDSIDFKSSDSLQGHNLLSVNSTTPSCWGLVYYRSKFFISYNGGWGPCLFAIDIRSGKNTGYCCPHPIGMKIIGSEWWCVRGGSNGQGDILATLASTQGDSVEITSVSERYRSIFPFQATDLAYDASNLWLVEQINSKIHKMHGFQTSVYSRPNKAKCEPSVPIIKVSNGQLRIMLQPERVSSGTLLIVDTKGRTIARFSPSRRNAISYDCSALSSGIYGIRYRPESGSPAATLVHIP